MPRILQERFPLYLPKKKTLVDPSEVVRAMRSMPLAQHFTFSRGSQPIQRLGGKPYSACRLSQPSTTAKSYAPQLKS